MILPDIYSEPNLIQIKKKDKSDKLIIKYGLNKMSESIFYKGQLQEVKDFMNKTQHAFYSMRDKNKSTSKFLYKLTPEEVIQNINNLDRFSLNESLVDADTNHLILQGDIQILKNWTCIASLSDERGISNRMVQNNPKYKLFFNLINDIEPSILGLKQIIDYYIIHELFGFVLEFSLYDVPVGTKKENIIIWEIRDY